VTEYHDGILLFEIMEKEVWKKAMNDSAGLANYFSDNNASYMWQERLDAKIYICNTLENAEMVKTLIEENETDSVIESELNKSTELGLTIREGKFERGEEKFLENVAWSKGISHQEVNGSFLVVNVLDVLPQQNKELTEVKGLVTSAYQDELDTQWVKELRTKYEYTINSEALNSAIK
jgi:peptidyl-prolyl cis-trans isomerase SurA